MSEEIFKEYFEVRDNEVDIQGIVSNIHYSMYFAHARHKYIKSLGIDFNEYAKRGKNFVVLECTQQFKASLKPSDFFYVTCCIVPTDSPIRFCFDQEIRLQNTEQLIAKGRYMATCINTQPEPGEKKIYIPEDIKKHLKPLCNP